MSNITLHISPYKLSLEVFYYPGIYTFRLYYPCQGFIIKYIDDGIQKIFTLIYVKVFHEIKTVRKNGLNGVLINLKI